jgi:hypothetical protein
VDVAEVREVEQVVADERLRRLVVEVARDVVPFGVVAREVVGQERRVGARLVAHPDEHPLVLDGERIPLHARLRRHRFRSRDLDAAAGRVEQQAVVAAAHAVAFLPALRERREAMGSSGRARPRSRRPRCGKSRIASPSTVRVKRRSCRTSWSQAITYQQLRTNIALPVAGWCPPAA